MRWKLGVLGFLVALAVFILIAPLPTMKVTVNLPRGAEPPTAHAIASFATTAIYVGAAVIMVVILVIAALLARRIIRDHRDSS
ncbi:MAG: hypothetical protein ABI306_10010 [Caulobacteraceae bacterium]